MIVEYSPQQAHGYQALLRGLSSLLRPQKLQSASTLSGPYVLNSSFKSAKKYNDYETLALLAVFDTF
jgi:hypothetical protein